MIRTLPQFIVLTVGNILFPQKWWTQYITFILSSQLLIMMDTYNRSGLTSENNSLRNYFYVDITRFKIAWSCERFTSWKLCIQCRCITFQLCYNAELWRQIHHIINHTNNGFKMWIICSLLVNSIDNEGKSKSLYVQLYKSQNLVLKLRWAVSLIFNQWCKSLFVGGGMVL